MRVWFDVGAYHGVYSLPQARADPNLLVYAFEPLPNVAKGLAARSVSVPNYNVVQVAVTEHNGTTEFFVNGFEMSSSVLPIDQEERSRWQGGEWLVEETRIEVPCVRLDTFMREIGVKHVDYLKIDAQGLDLAVVRSLGERISDVDRVVLEVALEIPLYRGGHTRVEALKYMGSHGFSYHPGELQSYDQEENMVFIR